MIVPMILKIRLMQFMRFLKELGFVRILLLLPFIGVIILIFSISVLEANRLNLTFAMVSISLLNIHFSRKDKNFLKKITPNSFLVYWSEYLLLFSPVWFLYAYTNNWQYFGIFIGIILLVAFVSLTFSNNRLLNYIQTLLTLKNIDNYYLKIKIPFIPSYHFEWISGLRKHAFWLVLFYVVAIIFCKQIIAIPLVLIICSIFVSSFYMFGESRALLHIFELSPLRFILQKLKLQFAVFFIVFAPLMLLYLVFHYHYWYVMIFSLIIVSFLLSLSIILKYAIYRPNEELNRNMIFIWFSTVCFFITFLVPIPVILLVRNYRKAMQNLNDYLHDYN